MLVQELRRIPLAKKQTLTRSLAIVLNHLRYPRSGHIKHGIADLEEQKHTPNSLQLRCNLIFVLLVDCRVRQRTPLVVLVS